MDAPVSPQVQNNNYETKPLKMASMAKYVGASHWPQGKSVDESNHPNLNIWWGNWHDVTEISQLEKRLLLGYG